MLPQNTFLIRQTEKIESESSFINILCPQLLGFLNKSYFDGTVIFNSSPGGGKSTLLKTFSPEVLLELRENSTKDTYKDTYQLLSNFGVVDENEVRLLSVNIACARENYSLIDDLYDGGKAIQVFYELISLRILRKTLLAVLKCNRLEENDMNHITFKNIPDEWGAICLTHTNGQQLYQWALEKERNLCISIEEMNTQISTSMLFNNLAVLNLIQNGNILLSGVPIKQKVLVMFDDIHALSNRQRTALRDMIFTVRPNLAVWMTQRLVALSKEEIFGTNGRIHREYEIVNIDESIQQDKKGFYKALKNVADRRVALTYKDEDFEDKLEKVFSKKSEEKLDGILFKIKQRIDVLCKDNENFTNLYDYLKEKEYSSKWECIIFWQVLRIMIERAKQNQQVVWPFVSIYSIDKLNEEYSKLHKTAEYLICYNYNLPTYYGMDILQVLSSYNVEQFLDFAGELFELRIALDYVSKKKKVMLISQEEQERVIIKCAEEKWSDILRTFSMGLDIQIFISNIARMGCTNLRRNTASYAGGTFTGIGVKKEDLDIRSEKKEYEALLRMLKICVAYNLLSHQEVRHGSPSAVYHVFYLNRWICVKFKLPLGYGGWKSLSLTAAVDLLYENGE